MLIPHSRDPYTYFDYHFDSDPNQQNIVTVGRIIVFKKCDRESFLEVKKTIKDLYLEELISKKYIIVGDISESERDYTKDLKSVK